jgi:hypothetical protein
MEPIPSGRLIGPLADEGGKNESDIPYVLSSAVAFSEH